MDPEVDSQPALFLRLLGSTVDTSSCVSLRGCLAGHDAPRAGFLRCPQAPDDRRHGRHGPEGQFSAGFWWRFHRFSSWTRLSCPLCSSTSFTCPLCATTGASGARDSAGAVLGQGCPCPCCASTRAHGARDSAGAVLGQGCPCPCCASTRAHGARDSAGAVLGQGFLHARCVLCVVSWSRQCSTLFGGSAVAVYHGRRLSLSLRCGSSPWSRLQLIIEIPQFVFGGRCPCLQVFHRCSRG